MLDHMGFYCKNLQESKEFYIKILKPLGHELRIDNEFFCSFGPDDLFNIGKGGTSGGCHVAFKAKTRAEVDEFYKAGLEAGGKDNGAPGIRAHYGPKYYAAFILDLDGNNVEAVCQSE
ncbi:uncharacterized protein VTP21DRAFT_8219 [Calcarisporiella thermophila]|uniref:uncharacterized protein n=1 Tax=Calcarisporiella thermophila TaxID=911321 RepID=UPI0037429517